MGGAMACLRPSHIRPHLGGVRGRFTDEIDAGSTVLRMYAIIVAIW
jgi:hypothetical protein